MKRRRARARVFAGTERNLAFLAGRLLAGELVAVPTETVYGLAGNALDPRACAKIFRAKGRPSRDPLIVHIHSLAQLDLLCEPNSMALDLAKAFWPGAMTLVLPKRKSVPDIVTAGRDSVAVRMPAHPLMRKLLQRAGIPLAAPSANRFGYISPTTVEHVLEGLGAKVPYVLDGGPCRLGLESTIVDVRDSRRPVVLRPGVVTAAEIERAIGRRLGRADPRNRGTAAQTRAGGMIAPGQLARHYSPRTRLILHDQLPPAERAQSRPNDAFVYLRRPEGQRAPNVFWLDSRGHLAGVARQLFATLRKLDPMKFQRIHVQRAPHQGLGVAINDRLSRAAAR
jgi:L-threonylcarbamoyladenylate synthase